MLLFYYLLCREIQLDLVFVKDLKVNLVFLLKSKSSLWAINTILLIPISLPSAYS